MNAAPRSSRVVMNRIDESAIASITWRFSSPGSPKTYSTPSFSRQSTSRRATRPCRLHLSPGYPCDRPLRSARGIPGGRASSADGTPVRPAARPRRHDRSHHRRGPSRPVRRLLSRARAPRARHPGDGRRVLGDDPRSGVRLGGRNRRARADGPDPAAPGPSALPGSLRTTGQDRVRHGRGVELAGPVLGDRRGDGRRC